MPVQEAAPHHSGHSENGFPSILSIPTQVRSSLNTAARLVMLHFCWLRKECRLVCSSTKHKPAASPWNSVLPSGCTMQPVTGTQVLPGGSCTLRRRHCIKLHKRQQAAHAQADNSQRSSTSQPNPAPCSVFNTLALLDLLLAQSPITPMADTHDSSPAKPASLPHRTAESEEAVSSNSPLLTSASTTALPEAASKAASTSADIWTQAWQPLETSQTTPAQQAKHAKHADSAAVTGLKPSSLPNLQFWRQRRASEGNTQPQHWHQHQHQQQQWSQQQYLEHQAQHNLGQSGVRHNSSPCRGQIAAMYVRAATVQSVLDTVSHNSLSWLISWLTITTILFVCIERPHLSNKGSVCALKCQANLAS